METESSLRNVVFLNKNRTMDNVQKYNGCTVVTAFKNTGYPLMIFHDCFPSNLLKTTKLELATISSSEHISLRTEH
jgi:hypothetical protein